MLPVSFSLIDKKQTCVKGVVETGDVDHQNDVSIHLKNDFETNQKAHSSVDVSFRIFERLKYCGINTKTLSKNNNKQNGLMSNTRINFLMT